jgi:anhydro-N-acetylmuramic acid kinase
MNQRRTDGVLTAIGLMSGTSMDGIDAALLASDGEGVIEPGPSRSRGYEAGLRKELHLAAERMAAAADPAVLRGDFADLELRLTRLNLAVVRDLLAAAGRAPDAVDVIGYHGQTVLHRPACGITIQLGDGAALAVGSGIAVIGDFRAADVAAGGEGAPFAPAYHRALAARTRISPQAVVNIGGVANVTWLCPGHDPIAFDTGPGNALIDDFVRQRTGQDFDRGGALALAGTVDETALSRLLDHPYFDRAPPKSLDRNAFSRAPVDRLGTQDGAATLVAFTAGTIAMCGTFFPEAPRRWVAAGGGRKNAAIMAALGSRLAAPVLAAEDAGWRGDDVEAEAFAYLAVRSLRGLPLSWPSTTGVPRPMTGGVMHRP